MSCTRDHNNGWSFFLERGQEVFDKSSIRATVQGRRILITGAGGFIGSALARSLSQLSVGHLSLLDIAESGLQDLALDLDQNGAIAHELIVGDVCDAALLTEIFKRRRPQIVLHAAACKHVSLMEENPFAAARTNVLGTLQLVQAASALGADKMIVISTDKAVAPVGIMGATKRIAELMVLANRSATQMNAVRLGNVLGSTGSVVPILQRQIAQGGPITITDAACTRYFVSISGAVQRLLSALALDRSSAVLVSQPGSAYRIIDLAHSLLESAGLDRRQIQFRFTGLRPGEKISEQMTSFEERLATSDVCGLQEVVRSSRLSDQLLSYAIEEIRAALQHRDLGRLLQAISSVVPEYSPSVSLQQQITG
jgi:FlaA1/EpsC-like NDP-sugar epimerase